MQNWRTTLVGIGCGIGNLWAAGGDLHWGQIGISAGLALLGFLSKDFAVSGTKNPDRAGGM